MDQEGGRPCSPSEIVENVATEMRYLYQYLPRSRTGKMFPSHVSSCRVGPLQQTQDCAAVAEGCPVLPGPLGSRDFTQPLGCVETEFDAEIAPVEAIDTLWRKLRLGKRVGLSGGVLPSQDVSWAPPSGCGGGQAPSQLHRPRGASGESLQRPLLEVAVMRLSLCRGQ